MSELLLLVQVDDATGETLQHATQQILAAGARNVQILSSSTKKGRPGHVCLIDLPTEREDDVALLLGTELGVWGYRILQASHRHFDIRLEERRVVAGTIEHVVRCKYVRKGERLLAVKAEHDDLVRLQERLAAAGHARALRTLRAEVERAALASTGAAVLVLD
ncbi:MAG: DUF111 family protein [Burkholderiales bacterium]|nr:DUF111 family protein [Burkholderiales bacterium]